MSASAEQRKRSIRRPTNVDASTMDANIERGGALARSPRTEVAAAPP